jgi:hypothetical protein
VFLAAAIVLAVYVVSNVLYVSQLALLAAGVAVVVFGWIWYGLPLIGRSPAADDQAQATEPSGADPGESSVDSRAGRTRSIRPGRRRSGSGDLVQAGIIEARRAGDAAGRTGWRSSSMPTSRSVQQGEH